MFMINKNVEKVKKKYDKFITKNNLMISKLHEDEIVLFINLIEFSC